jgi:perosamine synthetase
MFRTVPPAGVPVKYSDIIRIARARLNPNDSARQFAEIIKELSGANHCLFINSGRAANHIILNTLRELAGNSKNEIIIPAYTCFSIPASIVRSGLKIRLADIVPETLDYDYDRLANTDFSKALAILPCNLFGIVSDWQKLRGSVKDRGIFLIDDSAQTMGLPFDRGVSGTLGDVGFYSFGRGKNMTVYSGGVILTNNDDIAEPIKQIINKLPEPGIISEIKRFVEFIFYAAMLKPYLYWIPDNLPFLGLGKTVYDENFSVEQLSKVQLCAGPVMFSKLQSINAARLENSNALAKQIVNLGRFAVPGWQEPSTIPYIRMPILAPDRATRDRAIQKLHSIGIVSSSMYPSTLRKIPGIEKHLVFEDINFAGAENVAGRLFTLPTHPYLKRKDINRIIYCLSRL